MDFIRDCRGKNANGLLLFVIVAVFLCIETDLYIRPSHGGSSAIPDPSRPLKYKTRVPSTRTLMGVLSPSNSNHSTRLTTTDDSPLEKDGTPESDPSVCRNATLMPAGTMPVIALASLPGSGNTWCRHLIESVTGIYTGSIYVDKALLRGGFLGEASNPYSGETVAVKMHEMDYPKKINRTIFLVRDFYDATLAEFKRQQAERRPNKKIVLDPHTYNPDSSAFNHTNDLSRVVTSLIKTWSKMTRTIADNFSKDNRLLVVYFDDLKTDLEGQLRRIVAFLSLPLENERLKCTIHHAEGHFHRPHHELSMNPFTKAMTDAIKSSVQSAQRAMVKRGLSKLRINDTSSRFSL